MIVLPRPGEASRVQEQDPVAVAGRRHVGVPVNRDLRMMAGCRLADLAPSFKGVVAMAMRHVDPHGLELENPLIGRVSKEVIVARNIIKGNVDKLSVDQFAPLKITRMQKSVELALLREHAQEDIILSVCIADDQDLHAGLSSLQHHSSNRAIMARSALPRWLISFFCSSVISALVLPYWGR